MYVLPHPCSAIVFVSKIVTLELKTREVKSSWIALVCDGTKSVSGEKKN